MSYARGLFTPVAVTLIGVGTGIAIFDPAFKQEKEQRDHEQSVEPEEQHASLPPPAEQVRKTEEAVANAGGATTIPENAERWAKVQSRQFSKPADTFTWSDVPLGRYSTPEKRS